MSNRENKSAKNEFVRLRQTASEIFRRHDPMNLISLGAPSDEYDPEVGTVLPRLKEARSETELRSIIHVEFVRWFGAGEAGPEHLYAGLARELWAAWSATDIRS